LSKFPIDPEIIKKRAFMPDRLSELSKVDPEAALRLLRDWGDGKKAITDLWDEIMSLLDEHKKT
jgi:hypothetical protein